MTTTIPDRLVLETTLNIVIDELELETDRHAINMDADLVEEYDADSLGLIQVLARVNKELSIRVPQEDAGKLTTVRKLVARIIDARDAEDRSS
jgi:acyl carrier protein